MHYFRILSCALLCFFSATAAMAQQSPPEGGTPKDFTLPPQQTFSLDNGLQGTLVPYGNVPKVVVKVVVQTGNVHEAADQVWLSDLMGDFLKEGTTQKSASQLSEAFARLGGELSVQVSPNTTTLASTVLSEFGPQAVALLAEVLQQPAFPSSEADRLKADMKRNLNVQLAQPGSQAYAQFYEKMYPDQPYGRIFPTEQMIDSYTVDKVEQFYQDNVGAQRTHVYVSGQFDTDPMQQAITEAFSDWASGPEPNLPVIQAQSESDISIIDRPDAAQSTIMMGLPVADPSSTDYTALDLMSTLLGGSFGSRITSNIREDKGYTYSPYSGISSRYRTAVWSENADVTSEHTGASLKEITKEIERLQNEAPSADELEGFQNYAAGLFVLQNSSPNGIIGQLQFVDLHQLDEDYLSNRVNNIHKVTPQQVQEMAKKYIDLEEMTIVIVGDQAQVNNQLQEINLEPTK